MERDRKQDDAISESDNAYDELRECGVQVKDEVMTVQSRNSSVTAICISLSNATDSFRSCW